MKQFVVFALFFFCLSACNNFYPVAEKVEDGYKDVLWVGDDLLLTGPLDMQTLLLLELAGNEQSFRMRRVIDPRFTLTTRFDPSLFLESVDMEELDVVIIQAFGIQRNFSDEDYEENALSWVNFFQSNNKEVLIFYPWHTIVDTEFEKQRLDELIHLIVWQENLVLIPVGPVWQTVEKEVPALQLHAKDGIHASAIGVYLSACVFYTSLTGDSAINNPVYTSIGYDEPEEIIKLDNATLQYLQKVAWETINDYLDKDEFRVIIKETP